MNRKIKLQRWGSTQSAGGGATPTLLEEFEQWAKVEQYSANRFNGEQQGLYFYDKKITFRAFPSRQVTSQFIIVYENKQYAINQLQSSNEGKVFYWIARCTKIDNV